VTDRVLRYAVAAALTGRFTALRSPQAPGGANRGVRPDTGRRAAVVTELHTRQVFGEERVVQFGNDAGPAAGKPASAGQRPHSRRDWNAFRPRFPASHDRPHAAQDRAQSVRCADVCCGQRFTALGARLALVGGARSFVPASETTRPTTSQTGPPPARASGDHQDATSFDQASRSPHVLLITA